MSDETLDTKSDADSLGGRLPLLSPSELRDDQRDLHERLETSRLPWATKAGFEMQLPDGRLIGPFNAFLHTPKISGPFLDWGKAQSESSGLTEEIRQVIILTVGASWDSDYELYAHTAVGRSAGLSPTAIDAIKAHQVPADVSKAALAAYRLVDVLLHTHQVPDDVYADAVASIGVEGVIAAVQLLGQYTTVCGLLNVFRVPAPRA